MTDTSKIIFIGLIVLALVMILLVKLKMRKRIKNKGTVNNKVNNNLRLVKSNYNDDLASSYSSIKSNNSNCEIVNYADSNRKADGDWENMFDYNNNLVKNSIMEKGNSFTGMMASDNYGKYDGGEVENTNDPEELFNIDNLMPEDNDELDWFEKVPEPVSVKNRHLINTMKPMGVNTIGTSLKNASHDIRGDIPVKKTIVSPFNNSSIEPDVNNRGVFG